MEYNNGNAPPLLILQRQYLVARSTESTTSSSSSSSSSSTSKPAISVTLIAIPVAVGAPALLVALFLGYFLIKNYKMNKKEEKEFLADPNFAPDEQGLPDYPIPKNVQRQNTKIKPSNGNSAMNKFKRNNKDTNDTVLLPFEGEFSNDHKLHEYVKNFGDGLSPYTATKHPLTESRSNISNSSQLTSPYAKDNSNNGSLGGSSLDGSTLKSFSNNHSPHYPVEVGINNNSSPLRNEAYRNSVMSKHSMVGEANPYNAYQDNTVQFSDNGNNESNKKIPFPPPVAKSSIKDNDYMDPYCENPYANNNSAFEVSPYGSNTYADSPESNYGYPEPIKDDSFATTANEMDEETSERLKSVYNMYFERMSRSNTLRAPNISNKAPPIPPPPPKNLDLQNLQSSSNPFYNNNMTQKIEIEASPRSTSDVNKPLPENPQNHRESEISTNSIFNDVAKADTASQQYASAYLESGNPYVSAESPIHNGNSTDNYHNLAPMAKDYPVDNTSYPSKQENFTANKNIQLYTTHNQQPASPQDIYKTEYQATGNGNEYTPGNYENSRCDNYGNRNQNYVSNNETSHYEGYGNNYDSINSYNNNSSYENSSNDMNYSNQYQYDNSNEYGTNYVSGPYKSDNNNFSGNENSISSQKQLAPPAPIYDMNAGLVNGPNKVPTPADVARRSISMLNTVDLKSTKKYKPAASASSRMMPPQYNIPAQNQLQMPVYHQPKYLVSNAKRRNPNDLRKKLNVDPAFF